MTYEEFCEEIKLYIESVFGADNKINIMEVKKMNGVILKSFTLQKNNKNISPNINLEESYIKYQEAKRVESLAMDAYNCHSKILKNFIMPLPALTDFNMVKNIVFLKLINYDTNKKLLESAPYQKRYDLAVIFDVFVMKNTNEICSFHIYNEVLKRWGGGYRYTL